MSLETFASFVNEYVQPEQKPISREIPRVGSAWRSRTCCRRGLVVSATESVTRLEWNTGAQFNRTSQYATEAFFRLYVEV